MATPDDEMPEGFSRSEDGKSYANGFAFAGLKDLPAGVVNVTPQAGAWMFILVVNGCGKDEIRYGCGISLAGTGPQGRAKSAVLTG